MNYLLMNVTKSLYRPSGRALAKPIGVKLRMILDRYAPFSIHTVMGFPLFSPVGTECL